MVIPECREPSLSQAVRAKETGGQKGELVNTRNREQWPGRL